MLTFAVLGDIFSAMQGFNDMGFSSKDEGQDVQYSTFLKIEEDDVDLSLIIPKNFEEHGKESLQMADGILYYLDPNQKGNFEKLQEVLNLLQEIRTDFPIIIVIRTMDPLLKGDISGILHWLWFHSSACVFIPPHSDTGLIKEYLVNLCQTVISGWANINIATSWIQQSLFYSQINKLVQQSDYFEAARLCERLVNNLKQSDSLDYLILAEQAANLYAESGEFLKAANLISEINPPYYKQFERKYIETVLEEANDLFSKNEYEKAAEKYEMAGNWVKLELDDSSLMETCYKSAINAWIAQGELQNAFSLLDKFEHARMIAVLEEITEKIAQLADDLCENDQNEYAKSQLYLCFQRYQKAGLFESLQVLGRKVVKILKRILLKNLENNDVNTARLTYDELTNIWETYDIPSENIDDFLYRMAKLFIEKRDFLKAEGIIPKINSTPLQIELTNLRMETEKKIQELIRKGEIEDLTNKTKILDGYILFEREKFQQRIDNLQKLTEGTLNEEDFSKIEKKIIQMAKWFTKYGQVSFSTNAWLVLLDFYLNNEQIFRILENVLNLPEKPRRTFLQSKFTQIQDYFSRIKFGEGNEKSERNIVQFIQLYRNHLLYEESSQLATLYLKKLIAYAEILAYKIDSKGINFLLGLLNKIELAAKSYLDEESIDLDSVYVKLVKYYISKQEYGEARKYAEKIQTHQLSHSYCAKIDEIVSELSRSKVEKVQQSQKAQMFSEMLSQLQILARDQQIASENLLRMRNGLKRRYYNEAIQFFREKQYYKAIEKYLETAEELAASKKFELAGINFAVITFLYLLVHNISALKHDLHRFEKNPRINFDIFKKTFAFQLIDYFLQMIENNNSEKIRETLKIFNVFALFPEERLILETLIGEDIDFSSLLTDHQKTLVKSENPIPSNYNLLIENIIPNVQLKNRRKMFDLKYWGDCQDHFARQDYEDASLSFLEQFFNMVNRNYPEYAIISLIMGFLTLLKVKSQEEVYREFEKFMFQYKTQYEELLSSDPVKLLDFVLLYWDNPNAERMLNDIFSAFQSKLPLFDWEISFLVRLSQHFQHDSEKFEEFSNLATISSDGTADEDNLLDQQAIVLMQDISELANDFSTIMQKRKKMIRTYYQDIFNLLEQKKYSEASIKYIKLSKRMARRNDYNTASLMILLSAFCLIQNKQPLTEIQAQLDKVMNSLGLVKKILEDYFGVKLAFFTLDVMRSSNENIQSYLISILQRLPLLPQEKSLLSFESSPE